jgi:hypothetical protein
MISFAAVRAKNASYQRSSQSKNFMTVFLHLTVLQRAPEHSIVKFHAVGSKCKAAVAHSRTSVLIALIAGTSRSVARLAVRKVPVGFSKPLHGRGQAARSPAISNAGMTASK